MADLWTHWDSLNHSERELIAMVVATLAVVGLICGCGWWSVRRERRR